MRHRTECSSSFDKLSWQQYSHRDSLPDDGIMPSTSMPIDMNYSIVTHEAMPLKMAICNLTRETTQVVRTKLLAKLTFQMSM